MSTPAVRARPRQRSGAVLALGCLLVLTAVAGGAAASCRTVGREATASKTTFGQWQKPRVWARFVEGRWVPVQSQPGARFPSANFTALGSEGNVGPTATCCALKCRSTVVPKTLLSAAPYRSVVRIEMDVAGGKYVTYCSGSLVAPRIILTAKHCMDDSDAEPIEGGIVKAVYKSPGVHSVERNILRWRWFDKCRGKAVPDYGVILLDKAIPVPVLPLARTLKSSTKNKLSIIGFPQVSGRVFGQMLHDTISVGSLTADKINEINVQLIFDSGGSGGPVYAFGGRGLVAVGAASITYDDDTCAAKDSLLAGPVVFSSTHNVKDLMASL